MVHYRNSLRRENERVSRSGWEAIRICISMASNTLNTTSGPLRHRPPSDLRLRATLHDLTHTLLVHRRDMCCSKTSEACISAVGMSEFRSGVAIFVWMMALQDLVPGLGKIREAVAVT